MKWVKIPLLSAAIISVIACDRKADVGEKPENGRALKLLDLSPVELGELTASYYENASEDSSFLSSAEYLEVEAAHGPVFKKQLIAAIQSAATITIEEHSDPVDFASSDRPHPENPPRYVYRSVKLTDDQKLAFLRAAEDMDSKTVSLTPACFTPHHRMEFIRENGQRSSMSICFQCGNINWTEVNLFHPNGLFTILEAVVIGAGLKSERDWRALAKQRSEQNAAGQSATRPESK